MIYGSTCTMLVIMYRTYHDFRLYYIINHIINDTNIPIWFLKYFTYIGKLKVFESLHALVKKMS